jgi:hypothetical protein
VVKIILLYRTDNLSQKSQAIRGGTIIIKYGQEYQQKLQYLKSFKKIVIFACLSAEYIWQ